MKLIDRLIAHKTHTMRFVIACLLSILCAMGLGPVAFAAGPVVLARDRTAKYRIAIPENASDAEEFAASELKRYLDQISGASFAVSGKQPFVVACRAERLPGLAHGIAFPSLLDEEYGVFARKGNLYLVGGTDRAVLYAVYHFLEKLGCRWVAPDFGFYEGTGRSIPRITDLRYAPEGDEVQHPALIYRKLYIEEGRSHDTENLLRLIDWMPKARFNILVAPINYEGHGRVKWDNWRERLIPELRRRGIIVEVGGHGYQNFLNAEMEGGKLFEMHPEWFGADESGQRSPDPHRVFCSSNPDAVRYLHKNLLAYLDSHPEIGIFDFWPPDSERWCTCDRCTSLGSPSERHTLLVSNTAAFLRERKPQVRLECIAYSHYVAPAETHVLDRDVLVDFCPIRQCFEYPIYSDSSENNRGYRDDLKAWLSRFQGDVSIYSYYRKYAWRSLPNIIPHYMQDDLLFYHRAGAKGISTYSEPGDWFAYGVNHFVLGNLAWNPNVDVDSLVSLYCSVVYGGKVAAVATSVYKTLEEVVRHGCSIPHTVQKTPEEIQRFADAIAGCRQKVAAVQNKTESESVLRHHLDRLDLMLQYVEKDLALVLAKASDAPQPQVESLSQGIREWMVSYATAGVFVARRQ